MGYPAVACGQSTLLGHGENRCGLCLSQSCDDDLSSRNGLRGEAAAGSGCQPQLRPCALGRTNGARAQNSRNRVSATDQDTTCHQHNQSSDDKQARACPCGYAAALLEAPPRTEGTTRCVAQPASPLRLRKVQMSAPGNQRSCSSR